MATPTTPEGSALAMSELGKMLGLRWNGKPRLDSYKTEYLMKQTEEIVHANVEYLKRVWVNPEAKWGPISEPSAGLPEPMKQTEEVFHANVESPEEIAALAAVEAAEEAVLWCPNLATLREYARVVSEFCGLLDDRLYLEKFGSLSGVEVLHPLKTLVDGVVTPATKSDILAVTRDIARGE
jgi:hypothetical protein